jgi:hypothetical protein
MPTQTRFITVSGAASIDLSGVFEDLGGGTSYGTATNFKVGSTDLTGLFHASTSESDRANFNTKFLVNGTDLSAIFRRRDFSGLSITVQPQSQTKNEGETATFSITATTSTGTLSYQWKKWNGSSYANISGATSTSYTTPTLTASDDGNQYICTVSNGTSTLDSSVATLTVYYVTITDQPDGGGLNSGDALLLSVVASVNPIPSGCQWQFSTHNANSWSNIGSATGASYSKSLVPADEGDYRCVVSNSGASVTENSNAAYIEVFYQSNITAQPYQDPDPVVSNGTNDVEIKIVAAGKTTPTYQWQENISSTWTNLSNAGRVSNVTTSALKISDVEAGDDQREFRCVLSNLNATNDSFPDTTSNSVTLTVNYVPVITVQPVESVYNNGNSASYSVTANGRPSPNYQWQRSTDGGSNWSNLNSGDETSINGITTSNLTFTVQAQRAGYQYRCVVSNSAGSVNSNAVELLVNPFISVNLATTRTVTVASGQNTVSTGAFSITAYGSSLSYQWQKKLSGGSFTNVGTNSSSYTDSAVDEDENGAEYRCIVSTSVSGITATSNTCTLTVNLTAISISSFLGNGVTNPTVNEGALLTYSVVASGSGTLNYNFKKNGSSVQNGASSTYAFNVALADHNASYTCTVSSSKTSLTEVTSSSSTLTVNYISITELVVDEDGTQTALTSNEQEFVVDYGDRVKLILTAEGRPSSLSYEWKEWNGSAYVAIISSRPGGSAHIAGITSNTLDFNTIKTFDDKYYACYVSNSTVSKNTENSREVKIVINPIVTTDPSNDTAVAGEANSASFSVVASGTALSYQWRKNGSNVGTNSSSLTFTPTSADDQASIDCVVSSSRPSTSTDTSNAATLTVYYPPSIESVSVNNTEVTGNLQEFNIANGAAFTLSGTNINDGNPNAGGVGYIYGWYEWDGDSYDNLLSGVTVYNATQADNTTSYYRFRASNNQGTAESYEITVTTS